MSIYGRYRLAAFTYKYMSCRSLKMAEMQVGQISNRMNAWEEEDGHDQE